MFLRLPEIILVLFLIIIATVSLQSAEEQEASEGKPVIPEMVFIKGGTFQMGSDYGKDCKPPHTVTLSDFYIGKYEVTNVEFCMFLNSEGNQEEGGDFWYNPKEYDVNYCGIENPSAGVFKVKSDYERRPMMFVSWYGAIAYCNWLNEQSDLQKCYGEKDDRGHIDIRKNSYRLPTEAEWEYACRGGSTTLYYWGNKMNDAYCWCEPKYMDEQAHPVGQKLPNAWGLYDMAGNVYEWCNDWYGAYPSEDITNPLGILSGSERVIRGGCWYSYDFYCMSLRRGSMAPKFGNDLVGFRIARTP